MRTLSLLLPLLFLASCSCVARQPAPPDQPTDCKVGVLVDHGQFGWKDGKDGFYWSVWFTNHSDCPDLIQEIDLGGGQYLVEVFDVPRDGCVHDHHTVTSSPHARSMFIYPGEAVGVDRRNGWGQLPMNLSGTMATNIGADFNGGYQRDHRTQGRVIKERRNQGIHWTLSISQGKMTLTIGG